MPYLGIALWVFFIAIAVFGGWAFVIIPGIFIIGFCIPWIWFEITRKRPKSEK